MVRNEGQGNCKLFSSNEAVEEDRRDRDAVVIASGNNSVVLREIRSQGENEEDPTRTVSVPERAYGSSKESGHFDRDHCT